MVSVEEAVKIIQKNIEQLKAIEINVPDALGYVLAEAVYSDIDLPAFRQSAMDGYALKLPQSGRNGHLFTIIGEIKAGDHETADLEAGEAIRIFTGAPVPDSADVVVMQEKTEVAGHQLTIKESLSVGNNIRPVGEQVKKGDLALTAGTVINPACIGFLSMLGKTKVKVIQKPVISIIVTGNELVQPGTPLQYGQVYECNASAIKAALRSAGFKCHTVESLKDDYEATRSTLEKAIAGSGLVLISGGISVGDYDFVGKALQDLDTNTLFYKVKQKPGKPLFFGKHNNTVVFALPGNPAASLVCFYQYVYPALRIMSGHDDIFLPSAQLPVVNAYTKKGDRAQFLKAKVKDNRVEILEGQASSMLASFSAANALAFLGADQPGVETGDEIKVYFLPGVI